MTYKTMECVKCSGNDQRIGRLYHTYKGVKDDWPFDITAKQSKPKPLELVLLKRQQ